MRMKDEVIKQIKGIFKPEKLVPCAAANVSYASCLPQQASQLKQFGNVFIQVVSPEKCYATGEGVKVAEQGKKAVAFVHIVDYEGRAHLKVTYELVSDESKKRISCSVKKTKSALYEMNALKCKTLENTRRAIQII